MFEEFERKLLLMQQVHRPVLSKDDSVIYWQHVIGVLKNFKEVVFLRKPLKLLSKYYLDQLLEIGCSDYRLARRILKVHALSLSTKAVNYESMKKKALKRILAPLDDKKRYKKGEKSEMIEISMEAADVQFSRALAKYRVRYGSVSCDEITFCHYASVVSSIADFLYYVSKYDFKIHVSKQKCRDKAKDYVHGLVDTNGKIGRSIKWKFQKILFAIRIVKALTLKRYKNHPPFTEYLDCVRVHYRKKSFTTKDELDTFIHCLLKIVKCEATAEILGSFSADYEALSVHYGRQ